MRRAGIRTGFTLIELLVVIAIIAILAAILFPVFASAQRSAMKSRCVANEKQVLHAIQLYAQDNEGRVPPGYDPSSTSEYNWNSHKFGKTWNERVLPYAKNKDIFLCPLVPEAIVKNILYYRFRPASGSDPGGFPTTYGLNWRMTTGGGENATTRFYPNDTKAKLTTGGVFGRTLTLESVRAPSKTILIAESQHSAKKILDKGSPLSTISGGWGALVYDDDAGLYYWLIRWQASPFIPQGHGGGANFGMVDGHVQFVRAVPPVPSNTTVGTPPSTSGISLAGLRWW